MNEGTFLKLSGGYVRVEEIRWAERHDNGALTVLLQSRSQPLMLAGEDAAKVEAYLESRQWKPKEAE